MNHQHPNPNASISNPAPLYHIFDRGASGLKQNHQMPHHPHHAIRLFVSVAWLLIVGDVMNYFAGEEQAKVAATCTQ